MKIFNNKNIPVDLSKLIDSRMLLCANSGGGKSYTLRKILEEVGNDVMSIILDVEGEFKTIREKFDYLLIGQDSDVPLSLSAAKLLPQRLLELNVSTVIDISDLKMKERIVYVKNFLEALMELNKKYWKPCLIVVDEAHMYCGQQEKQDSTHAVIDLMTRGRKRGYCGVLATQRIAKLHKDAAAEANNYMIGRTGLDVDMKRASELLGFASKKDMLSLRNLCPGEFYVFGPAISAGVEKVKIAKVKTTHPKVGMDLRKKITQPTQKIKSILSKLSDLPKEAEQRAKTLKELKLRNAELERELKKKPQPAVDENQLKLAEQRGFNRGQKEIGYKYIQLVSRTKKAAGHIEKANGFLQDDIQVTFELPVKVSKPTMQPKPVTSNTRQSKVDVTEGDINLGRCERSILSLLYNNPYRGFKKTLVGLFTGYSHKSGGFNNALSKLRAQGLISRDSNNIMLMPDVDRRASTYLGIDINLHEQFTIENWGNKLPKCEKMIFEFLMTNSDMEFTKDEIGEQTGYSSGSGGFNNALSRLSSLALIIRTSGRIKLNSEILEK